MNFCLKRDEPALVRVEPLCDELEISDSKISSPVRSESTRPTSDSVKTTCDEPRLQKFMLSNRVIFRYLFLLKKKHGTKNGVCKQEIHEEWQESQMLNQPESADSEQAIEFEIYEYNLITNKEVSLMILNLINFFKTKAKYQ